MFKRLTILMIVLVLLLAACGAPAAAPTAAPATQAPVVEPTATSVPPTDTLVPATATAVPPTDTPAPPTDTPAPPTEEPTEAPTEEPTEEPADPTEEPGSGISEIPHAIAGIESQCLTCHGPAGVKPVPADHEGRPVDTCTTCHQLEDGAGPIGSTIPHAIVGMEGQCLTCHGEGGVKPAPADHAGRPVDTCTTCHQPQS